MFDSPPAPGPHQDLLAQDPSALADRAKGLQERRDRLDAEEADLLDRDRGPAGQRPGLLPGHRRLAPSEHRHRPRHRPDPHPRRPPARGAARRPDGVGSGPDRVRSRPGPGRPRRQPPPRQPVGPTGRDRRLGCRPAPPDAFRDRMGDWARDLDETRDAGHVPGGAAAPAPQGDPVPDQRRAAPHRAGARRRVRRRLLRRRSGTPPRRCNAPTGRPSCGPNSSAASVSSWPTPWWRWPAAPGAPM